MKSKHFLYKLNTNIDYSQIDYLISKMGNLIPFSSYNFPYSYWMRVKRNNKPMKMLLLFTENFVE